MRILVTGATGLIGSTLIGELLRRGDEVTVLSRDPARAQERLGRQASGVGSGALQAAAWNPLAGPPPADALAGRDAVVHLAGENIAQRWTARARAAIRDSRVLGTRNLVSGLEAAEPRPRVLISGSAVGYYGLRGEEPLDEDAPPGDDFLARVCADWEREAQAASALGLRVVQSRTGVVLDREGGALAKMLPPFRAGVGGPVAGGRQYMPWIHPADITGIVCSALDDERWSGPVNACSPDPVTNAEFSRALGHVLHRPAVMPVPAFALRLLYGDMSEIITGGARVVPARPLVLGYEFRHPELEPALRAALA